MRQHAWQRPWLFSSGPLFVAPASPPSGCRAGVQCRYCHEKVDSMHFTSILSHLLSSTIKCLTAHATLVSLAQYKLSRHLLIHKHNGIL